MMDVEHKYVTDKRFKKAINKYVKQWILDHIKGHLYHTWAWEEEDFITFGWQGKYYDINVFVPDDIDEPAIDDIRAVAYGLTLDDDGVNLTMNTEDECVMVDYLPSQEEINLVAEREGSNCNV
jgi:hypothetical protein